MIHSNVNFSGYGGGIYCEGSPLIEGNTIVGNECREGAGIFCDRNSAPIIKNNIIANNIADAFGGGGIYANSTSSPTIMCCDLFSNTPLNYKGIEDQTGRNGYISLDPLFCDYGNHDYTIHTTSPCAPGNNPYGSECGLIGALGIGCDYVETLLRARSISVDSGAVVLVWEVSQARSDLLFQVMRSEAPFIEYRELADAGITWTGTSYYFRDERCESGKAYKYKVFAADGEGQYLLFETDEILVPEMPLKLHQNYPNPFNPVTNISYYLPHRGHVRMEILDVSGRRVACLVDEEQEKGEHSVVWSGVNDSGREAAFGVYVCKLSLGKANLSRKIVLLR